mmetsp:Transcript_39679/g.105707  ORF Transcript_39679/g.105707 Transcript_39679/m.105707 type:complete len:610 (+) Transcript_39679:67-1896(+)
MPPTSSLQGKIVVFTGTLTMKRADATAKAKAAGATVTGSVSAKTNIVVAGPGAGGKLDEAKAKGVEVWTEEEFIAVVDGGGSDSKASKAAPAKGKAADEDSGASSGAKSKRGKKEAPAAASAEAEADPPPKAKRGAASKKPKEEVEEEEEKPQPKAKRGAASKKEKEEEPATKSEPPPKETKKRGAASKATAAKVEEETVEVAAPPAKKGRVSKAAAAATALPPAAKSEGSAASGGASSGGRGALRPDRLVPGGDGYSVHEDYHVKLMYSDIGSSAIGNNKFYIIQVLEKGGKFYSWNRWGRLGEPGQNALKECPNADAAIKLFESKFRDKTKNTWANRGSFERHPGSYQLVETEEEEGGGGEGGDAALGRLSASQIHKGQEVLAKIREALEKGKAKGDLTRLSSEFYSLIPTSTGRKAPPPINDLEILQSKEGLLDFWLRMGFEDLREDAGATPIAGVLELPLPPTLLAAAKEVSDLGSISVSQARGEQMLKIKAGKPVGAMDKELYGAILLYTGNSIYAALNRALRSEDRKSIKRYFSYLRLFLEAMDRMPKQVSSKNATADDLILHHFCIVCSNVHRSFRSGSFGEGSQWICMMNTLRAKPSLGGA